MIQVFKPSLGEEEVAAVAQVLESGWIGLGPRTREFEDLLAAYVGASFAIALNSGTAALHLALLCSDTTAGDEVIVPALTYVSTVHAIEYVGATPVFADVHEDTLCVDVADVARKLTARTRVVMPVHYGGHPCDMDELHTLAQSRGMAVIEDAAHACGASYRGQRIGGLSDATCFSFQAVKNLTTGQGGAVTTDNVRMAEPLRELRSLGINEDTWSRTEDGQSYDWYYEVQRLGYNYGMSDILAAVGIVQLQKLERTNARRRELVGRYNDALADLGWLDTPVERPYVTSACHNYVIRTDSRDSLSLHLKRKAIATGVHYMPVHLHPHYRCLAADVPTTDRVWHRLLTLPLYPDLTDSELDHVVSAIHEFRP